MFPYQLKIKIKSLAAEARIIRKDENKAKARARCLKGDSEAQGPFYERYHDLRGHRTGIVRTEARATLIAYGYLRGKSYAEIEAAPASHPDWSAADRMVLKYGTKEQWLAFASWPSGERYSFVRARLQDQRDKAA